MNRPEATPRDQFQEFKRLVDIMANVPPDRRALVTIATESFVNGLTARDLVANRTDGGPPEEGQPV